MNHLTPENSLNKIKFKGVPVGSLLCYPLTIGLSKGKPIGLSKFQFIIGFIKASFNFFRIDFVQKTIDRPWILLQTSDEKKNARLFAPILRHLPKDSYFFLRQKLSEQGEEEFLISRRLSFFEFVDWLSEFIRVFLLANAEINRLEVNSISDPKFKNLLKYQLLLQTQMLVRVLHLFKNSPTIKGLITDHDRQNFSSAVVLSLNSLSIKTTTMIHGAVFPMESFVPFLAKVIFGWGVFHTKYFQGYISSGQTMRIVGNQVMEMKPGVQEKSTSLKNEKKSVALFTNKYEGDKPQESALIFASCLDYFPNWNGFLKIHPLEEIDSYNQVFKNHPIKELNDADGLNSLSVAFVMNSGVIFDLISEGIPVILWAPGREYFGVGQFLIDSIEQPVFSSEEDFKKFFNKGDLESRLEKIQKDQEVAMQNYISAFGDQAAENIIKEIQK